MNDKLAMQNRIQKLGALFLQRTAADMVTLNSLIAIASSGDSDAMDQAHHLAHRIHGTGAIMGFGSVSRIAERIERVAERKPDAADVGAFASLVAGAAELEAEITRLVQAAASQ